MTTISGATTAFFLYDVGDAIDLARVHSAIGSAVTTHLTLKPATPPYIQYQQPPVLIDGGAIGCAEVHGFAVRLKAFDYGVVSVALTRPLPRSWEELRSREGRPGAADDHTPRSP